jgi:predicted alternative tryptophan synthase beta-subunit
VNVDGNPGCSTTDVDPNDVIWKHELYFLMSLRKCFDFDVSPDVLVKSSCSGGSSWKSFTFPFLQQIPEDSDLNVLACQ